MKENIDYYDISPLLSPRIAVFPGDTSFSRKTNLSILDGHNILLSQIQTTLHVGAHADAPNHYSREGEDIGSRDLNFYLGLCEVKEAKVPKGDRVRKEHFQNWKPQAPRMLVKTRTFMDPDRWNSDFASLSPELISAWAIDGVMTVGIDTPSIDPETSKDLPAHQAIAQNNMAILEGLILDDVPDGIYQLIALPLRIEGADASPVRAILIKPNIST